MGRFLTCFAIITMFCLQLSAQETRINLEKCKLVDEADLGNAATLIDEQQEIIGPPAGKPTKGWKLGYKYKDKFPVSVYLDLGEEKNLSKLWLFDTNNKGDVVISYGSPDNWKELTTYGCNRYNQWASIPLDVKSRYLRLTKKSPSSNFTEIAVYEYSPEAWKKIQERKAQEKAQQIARQKALKKAMEEIKKRPLVDLGKPFGKCYLVDEVDCTKKDHGFEEYPKGNSKVETILGRECRVIPPVKGSSSFIAYRLGKMKLLQGGQPLVLVVDYPEDAPRTVVVVNNGNETRRGFHTGPTVGDSFHPKYVNNLNESINTPLSGKWEQYKLFFQLHDKFVPGIKIPRGDEIKRTATPEDGFYVTISQFSKKNLPLSKGVAVSKIRLFAVPDKSKLDVAINYPPKNLPRRRIFWREEMADGVLGDPKKKDPNGGMNNFLDWYRYKAELMKLLGINTFTKDLLEFGHNQGWDSTPYGGNKWVYMNPKKKVWWPQIVEEMGKQGFDILPYYEYAGSRGQKGLGHERRCKPLKRTDGYYTHIKWVEGSTADITDPDTIADFKKMLDLTIINEKHKAKFVGAWLRPRGQTPISFADTTLKRFTKETGKEATRKKLIADKALYQDYIKWWNKKRHEFLASIRDYLRANGVNDKAIAMYTGNASEPGPSFTGWKPKMVTDQPQVWKPILGQKKHFVKRNAITPFTVEDVINKDLYLTALTSPGSNWGGYEINHFRPADDPERYNNEDGIIFTHAYNRLYTVSSPKTFDAYRTPSGLAAVRYHALNEHMVHDENDSPILGYFVVDMEKAGPYCMMAEAAAMANGDPTMLGYLAGCNFGRGFPKYVRNFNRAYLSLPALKSKRLENATSDPEVVVREIKTPKNGTYYSIVNTGMKAKKKVTVNLPAKGKVINAATGKAIKTKGDKLKLSFYPYQLKAIHVN